MEYTGNCLKLLSFWAINEELKLSVLKGQLEEMKAMGLRGTVFHPRYYPGRPAYMSGAYLDILSEIILYAGQLEMEFWIYDENGWPSGSADGHVLEHFPDSRCEWLNYRNGEVVLEGKAGFNTFRRDEMAYFIEYTYDGYRKGLSEEAFACVTGFFSDEVGFLDGHGVSVSMGGIPWCPEAEEVYGQLRGRKLRDDWKLLFTEGEGYEEVRLAYWKILGDILSDAFYKPVNQWCEAHGKRYTAHLKGEETLFFQTSCSGSLYQNLKQINVPAVDALERYPGNHYYPRTVSSLSRQFSDGRCMAAGVCRPRIWKTTWTGWRKAALIPSLFICGSIRRTALRYGTGLRIFHEGCPGRTRLQPYSVNYTANGIIGFTNQGRCFWLRRKEECRRSLILLTP